MSMNERLRQPPQEQIDVAVMWLRSNEGKDGGEKDACSAVADWIEATAEERWLRKCARDAGVPVARLRRKLAEQAAP